MSEEKSFILLLQIWRGVRRRYLALRCQAALVRGRLVNAGMTMVGSVGLKRPGLVMGFLRFARRIFPSSTFLTLFEGLVTSRSRGWGLAAKTFEKIPTTAERRNRLSETWTLPLLHRPMPHTGLDLSVPAQSRTVTLSPDQAQSVVIYTTWFGRGRSPSAIFAAPAGLRFLCFTDHAENVVGWRMVRARAYPGVVDYHRICAHKVLGELEPSADASLYLDPDKLILGNLHCLLNRWLLPHVFVLWRHPTCADWHELAERKLLLGAVPTFEILRQARSCEENDVVRRLGAYATSVIWRRHRDPGVVALMEDWWRLHEEALGCSEISFYRLWESPKGSQHDVGAKAMPECLGTADDNIFVGKRVGPLPRVSTADNRREWLSKRVKVVFLCPEDCMDRVTAMLRGRQLSQLVHTRFSDIYDVCFTGDVSAARNSVVILTPYALHRYGLDAITNLRANNVALIGAWEDGSVDDDKAVLLDAHMAISVRQMLYLERRFSKVPAFHVTAHVNLEIPETIPQQRVFRTGYFGGIMNTTRPDALSSSVELFRPSDLGRRWWDILPEYNCHWIVRQHVPGFGHKPFLKGFVAARSGAVVIVTRDDENAAYYLGDDYPFYADSLRSADLENAWIQAAAAFGGDKWQMAREIMRQVPSRSSDAYVASEFKAMVDEVLR